MPRKPLRTAITAIIIIVVIGFLLLSYYLDCLELDEKILTNESAVLNLLIASDNTEFKNKLRSKIIQRYRGQNTIRVVNIRSLRRIDPEEFDLSIIFDTNLAAWINNKPTKNYRSRAQGKSPVLLLMTSGNWPTSINAPDVDAISCASKIDNIKPVYLSLTAQIDSIILCLD